MRLIVGAVVPRSVCLVVVIRSVACPVVVYLIVFYLAVAARYFLCLSFAWLTIVAGAVACLAVAVLVLAVRSIACLIVAAGAVAVLALAVRSIAWLIVAAGAVAVLAPTVRSIACLAVCQFVFLYVCPACVYQVLFCDVCVGYSFPCHRNFERQGVQSLHVRLVEAGEEGAGPVGYQESVQELVVAVQGLVSGSEYDIHRIFPGPGQRRRYDDVLVLNDAARLRLSVFTCPISLYVGTAGIPRCSSIIFSYLADFSICSACFSVCQAHSSVCRVRFSVSPARFSVCPAYSFSISPVWLSPCPVCLHPGFSIGSHERSYSIDADLMYARCRLPEIQHDICRSVQSKPYGNPPVDPLRAFFRYVEMQPVPYIRVSGFPPPRQLLRHTGRVRAHFAFSYTYFIFRYISVR